MIKLIFCLRRLPHLSLGEFQRYWRETHGPRVHKHAETLRIRRYVQVHTLDTPLNDIIGASRGAGGAYDGVAELWFERTEDLTEATSTPEGRKAALELLEDERRFIDLPRSALWVAEEHTVVDS